VCVVAGGQWGVGEIARGAWVREGAQPMSQLKLLGLAACLDAAIHHAIAERLDGGGGGFYSSLGPRSL
jgi:hypothetical protein